MAAEAVAGEPFVALRDTPVWVSVVCVVVHLLQVAHQLKVCVSVFFVVGAPAAGGVERQPGFRVALSLPVRGLRCGGRWERF